MTGQLTIFQSSGSPPLAAQTTVEAPLQEHPVQPVTPEAARTAEPAGAPDTTTDDGSLHWMLTGQPQPKAAA